ncbi:hypothetical protein [Agromyces sp. PvR057]|uniref:hypothetical protein n=1 Tax=Agromyces sp. PvR057 TaxID=3156403 RepID=UPI003391278F
MDRILLTDDEVVAAAALLGGAWRAPLPTVSVEDPGEMIKAAARGRRSLGVRGLMQDGATLAPQLAEALSAIVRRRPDRMGYVGEVADRGLLAGGAFAAFLDGELGTLVVTTANGVNEFTRATQDEIDDFVVAFVAAGRSEERRPIVVVAPVDETTTRFAVATRDSVLFGLGPIGALDLESGDAAPEFRTDLLVS